MFPEGYPAPHGYTASDPIDFIVGKLAPRLIHEINRDFELQEIQIFSMVDYLERIANNEA
jgi:hypothetical protein